MKALLKEASEQAEVKLIQEGVILAQFGHPNVLSLVGILTQSGRPSLVGFHTALSSSADLSKVTEFLARGPLDRYLRRARPDLPMMLGFARDICTGLNYLSTCSFVVGVSVYFRLHGLMTRHTGPGSSQGAGCRRL